MTTYTVSSGQTSSMLPTVQSADLLIVQSGGTAVGVRDLGQADVSGTTSGTYVSQGVERVLSGATATGTEVDRGGFQDVVGSAISTIVDVGGALLAEQGGITTGAILNGGNETVRNQASEAFGTDVKAGGSLDITAYVNAGVVADGGTASGTLVEANGSIVVYLGTAYATLVEPGGYDTVSGSYFGTGADQGATVSGGLQTITGGGTATGTVLNAGALELVGDGQTAGSTLSTRISDGSIEIISALGSATATTVGPGGILVALPGATVTGTIVAGGTVVSTGVVMITPTRVTTLYGASAAAPVVGNGATLFDLAGGVVSGAILRNAGIEEVAGFDTAATVFSGGSQLVISGGSSVATTLSGGVMTLLGGTTTGTRVGSGSTQTVSAGIALGTIVSVGGVQTVSRGADDSTAVSSTILAGGQQAVDGTAVGTIVSGTSAMQTVTGVASRTTLSAGAGQLVTVYGRAIGTDVGSGALQMVSGTTSSTVVSSGGTVDVTTSGVASGVIVNNGGILRGDANYPGGRIIGAIVNSGGLLTESLSGNTIGTVVNSGGVVVATGGIETSAVVSSGGVELISSGAYVYGATVSTGGYIIAYPGAVVTGTMLAGGVVVSTGVVDAEVARPTSVYLSSASGIVQQSGIVTVLPGGTAINTTGTSIMVDSGGQTSGTVVQQFGNETVSGGVAIGTHVGEVGTQTVVAGGLAVGTVASEGYVVVGAGGVTSAATVVNGGIFYNSGGTDFATTVGYGCYEVDNGGVASGAMINGGDLFVAGGGIAINTTVAFGVISVGAEGRAQVGPATFSGPGMASGTVLLSGATEVIDKTGSATATTLTLGTHIELLNFPLAGNATGTIVNDVLTITEGANTYTQTLVGDYTGDRVSLTSGTGYNGTANTLATLGLACFCTGTQIMTDMGERPVESLAEGDRVLTLAGHAARIRWMGFRHIDLTTHPYRECVQPVRIPAGRLPGGLPRRDLLVSPEHAIHLNGVFIPARLLLGCAGIAPDRTLDATTYWHIELDQHQVVFAEGLPTESWLDTGNRAMFQNAPVAALRYDPQPNPGAAWALRACAPLVTEGPLLASTRQRLGISRVQIAPILRPGVHHITIEPGRDFLRLDTPTARIPGDPRALGASILAAWCDGHAIPLDDARFGLGFFANEGGARWTNGAARLELGPADRRRALLLFVHAIATVQVEAA